MSAAHTAGPWRFYTEPQPNGCPIVGTDGLMVAMLAHSINYDDQRETAIANARLISAAPELLRVAEMLVEALADDSDSLVFGVKLGVAHGFARAAIAKATGGAQ